MCSAGPQQDVQQTALAVVPSQTHAWPRPGLAVQAGDSACAASALGAARVFTAHVHPGGQQPRADCGHCGGVAGALDPHPLPHPECSRGDPIRCQHSHVYDSIRRDTLWPGLSSNCSPRLERAAHAGTEWEGLKCRSAHMSATWQWIPIIGDRAMGCCC